MAKIVKGEIRNPNGRPKGSGSRQAMDRALAKYGEEKFWDETFLKAKTDSTVRNMLIKKLVADPAPIDDNGKPLPILNFYIPERNA